MTNATAADPTITSPAADASMDAWLRDNACPSSVDAMDAVLAGLLVPASADSFCRYVCTDAGREWLVQRAINNTGCSRQEAAFGLDYIEGA